MKNTHPITVLLALTWLALEAVVTVARALLVPTIALVLTLADWLRRPERCRVGPEQATPLPVIHPLAAMAEQLTTEHTRRQLQQLAGTRSNLSKAALAGMVVACS